MSYGFNTTKAQRKMVRRWCLDHGVYTNSHPMEMRMPYRETHNGIRYSLIKNFDKSKYKDVEHVAWTEWVGQSLEELSDACAYLRMTLPARTAIVILVRSPPPIPSSRTRP